MSVQRGFPGVTRPDGGPREWLVTVATFTLLAFLASIAYTLVVIIGTDPTAISPEDVSSGGDERFAAMWFAWMTLSVVPAAVVYLYLPDETVDRYHKLGKVFALLIPINVALTGSFLTYQYFWGSMMMEWHLAGVILFGSMASVGLPAPYAAALAGARMLNGRFSGEEADAV